MTFVWNNLSYEGRGSVASQFVRGFCCCLDEPQNKILGKVNGKIHLGQLTALMGPSGAGKSTLLKCITKGKNYTGFEGKLLTNMQEDIRASFITQTDTDHLLMNLTVRESIRYAAELKNPNMEESERKKIVDKILADMNLAKVQNNLVEKCSGGEKKKIAVALELSSVPKPNFLLLDEPTTGLDSFSGTALVKMLRRVALESQIAIIATIHQPSEEIFKLFHHAFVMSKAGDCIYMEDPKKLQDHIRASYSRLNRDFPNIPAPPQDSNPADNIIKIACAVSRNQANAKKEIKGWCINFSWPFVKRKKVTNSATDPERPDEDEDAEMRRNEPFCKYLSQYSQNTFINSRWNVAPLPGFREIQETGLCSNKSSFDCQKLRILFKRSFRTSLWKNKKFVLLRFALHFVVAGVLALLYSREMGKDDGCFVLPLNNTGFDPHNCSCIDDIEETLKSESVTSKNVAFQFFSLLFLMFAALMPTVLTFPSEIKLFLNEHMNGWYSTSSYYLSKTLVEIPFQFLFPVLYTYFLYWYSQQIGMDYWYSGVIPSYMTWRYAYFIGVTVLSCFVAQGMGFLIGILCVNSFNISVVLSSSVLLFLFLFSGFFVKTMAMGLSVRWITYLSFIRFSFESLLLIIYGFERCTFVDGPDGNQLSAGNTILYTFSLKDEDLTRNIYWLLGHLMVIRLSAFLLLWNLADPSFLQSGPDSAPQHFVTRSLQLRDKVSKMCMPMSRGTFIVVKLLFLLFLVQLGVGIVTAIIQLFQNEDS